MNIHEYQGKAVLKEFGVPVSARRADLHGRRGRGRGEGTRRSALGGEVPDPCGRPRQGQVQGSRGRREGRRAPRQVDRRGEAVRAADARPHARHRPDRRGRQAGQPPLYRGRLGHREASSISRCWSTARPARVAFVVSTEGGMDIEQVAHDTPEKIHHLLGRSGDRRHAASRPHGCPGARPQGRLSPSRRRTSRPSSTRPSSRRTWRCWRSTR